MKIIKLEQGSPEWLAWRQSGIGSSDIPIIIGVSPWTKPDKLLEEKVSGKPARKSNGAMRRGHDLEPIARAIYEDLMGFKLEAVCAEDDEYPWAKVSLDGWNAALRVSVEIKAPNKDDHALALEGKIPEKYTPQCDWQIGISGACVHHYVSYNPTSFSKAEEFKIVPYSTSAESVKILRDAAKAFWDSVLEQRKLRGLL